MHLHEGMGKKSSAILFNAIHAYHLSEKLTQTLILFAVAWWNAAYSLRCDLCSHLWFHSAWQRACWCRGIREVGSELCVGGPVHLPALIFCLDAIRRVSKTVCTALLPCSFTEANVTSGLPCGTKNCFCKRNFLERTSLLQQRNIQTRALLVAKRIH